MEPPDERVYRWFPLLILLAFFLMAISMLWGTELRTEIDPDALITDLVMIGITVIVFLSVWKFHIFLLETGLSLIIYASGIHIIEELTREFTLAGLLAYTCVLTSGFILICVGIIRSRRSVDTDIEQLRIQEQTIRAHAEELTRLSGALAQANQKLRLLSQITRHDIANRLLVASGYFSIAKKRKDSAEKEADLEKIQQALQAIHGIISFTANYEEIGLNAPEWQKVRPLVDAASGQLVVREGVRVINDCSPDLSVYADTMFPKVFFNLLENALAYAGEDMTQVRFSTQPDSQDFLIICEDNGCGIPPEYKERVFQKGVGKNTGLGLFLSQEILSITDLAIQETGTPGTGARFEIHVPSGKFRL